MSREAAPHERRLMASLTAFRKRLGLTQHAAADLAGMDRSWWKHLERGRPTRVATVGRMAEVVGARLELVDDARTLTAAERKAVGDLIGAFVLHQNKRGRRVSRDLVNAWMKIN